MKKLLLFAALLSSTCSAVGEVVSSCNIGPGPTVRVEVTREHQIADTWVYSLRHSGRTRPIFTEDETSRGSSVQTACVGSKNHALVVSGEFSANALQGFVLTYVPGKSGPGRFDFAEKRRPAWLFLSNEETILAVPTGGLGETSKRYVAYRNATGVNGEPSGQGVDWLPDARRYEKINLNGNRKTVK
jgi:hypothetical protein